MRHDAHYVEELSSHRPIPIGRLILVESIDPNPDQPRVEIGDLTDLIASVKDKGILEPLLVKPASNGRWMIIAGERRWRAARACGLREVPCIEMEVDDRAVAEIALIENLQRKDLTPWEEADGLAALCERYGYTHEEVAKKVGKSRTTVTESLSISSLPDEIREECRRADINVKSVLLQIVRQPDENAMRGMVAAIARKGLTRDEVREVRRTSTGINSKSAIPKTFRFDVASEGARVEVKFRKGGADLPEVVKALEGLIEELKLKTGKRV